MSDYPSPSSSDQSATSSTRPRLGSATSLNAGYVMLVSVAMGLGSKCASIAGWARAVGDGWRCAALRRRWFVSDSQGSADDRSSSERTASQRAEGRFTKEGTGRIAVKALVLIAPLFFAALSFVCCHCAADIVVGRRHGYHGSGSGGYRCCRCKVSVAGHCERAWLVFVAAVCGL